MFKEHYKKIMLGLAAIAPLLVSSFLLKVSKGIPVLQALAHVIAEFYTLWAISIVFFVLALFLFVAYLNVVAFCLF